MTQGQLKSLSARQMTKSSRALFVLAKKRNTNLSPMLLRRVLLTSKDGYALGEIVLNFSKTKKGISFLNSVASEKVNPNEVSRRNIMLVLSELAEEGKPIASNGLMIGMEDSSALVRVHAARGIKNLIKNKIYVPFDVLKKGLEDSSPQVSHLIIDALGFLVQRGNIKAIGILAGHYGRRALGKVKIRKKGN
jgi:hypothetical protein